MIGLALEGGGARGAYHVGVVKALYEAGYQFDGFCGTSIGSINAAILAQGDFDKLHELWMDIQPAQLFGEPLARLMALGERSYSGDLKISLPQLWREIREAGLDGGVDTKRMKQLISDHIDEDKLRASGKLFGLVTVCISEFHPRQFYLDEIPDGQIVEYLMASASFPGFEPEVIDSRTYVDGGLYNNCPVNMLTDKGYDRVIAIRTHGPGVYWLPKTDADISVIEPSRDLGNVMSFDNALAKRNIQIGYLDAQRYLRNLLGFEYFIEPGDPPDFGALFMSLNTEHNPSPLLPTRRELFERALPTLGGILKLPTGYSYDDLAIALLQATARLDNIESLQILSFAKLASLITESSKDAARSGDDALTLQIGTALASAMRTVV